MTKAFSSTSDIKNRKRRGREGEKSYSEQQSQETGESRGLVGRERTQSGSTGNHIFTFVAGRQQLTEICTCEHFHRFKHIYLKQNKTLSTIFKRQDVVKVCSLINVFWLCQFTAFDNTLRLCKILPAEKLSNGYLGQFRTCFLNLLIYFSFFERVLLCNSVYKPNWLGISDNPTWTLGCQNSRPGPPHSVFLTYSGFI